MFSEKFRMIFITIWIIFLLFSKIIFAQEYSLIKKIGETVYVGGADYLSSYELTKDFGLRKVHEASIKYSLEKESLMNGSDIGFEPYFTTWSDKIDKTPTSLAFDNCLNWKDENTYNFVRSTAYDYSRIYHHTMSGDMKIMSYTCLNSFIKGVEEYDENYLWICGTFGTFPRAFLVNRTTLQFHKFVDTNVMSCARYIDEPMATFRDKRSNRLYVASGWGLYKPAQSHPDIPNNNSTMMYSDWRLYRNLFTLPSDMAWVLSSDVNFINFVQESDDHLYFFGHEVSKQYGLNNQEDRQARQSFLLRICKNDNGFKYIPREPLSTVDLRYLAGRIENDFTFALNNQQQGYNKSWYETQAHLPFTHFTTPLKINFGCYIEKRPRAISDNHFWGDTNVVYLNRLADVIFNHSRRIKFKTKNNPQFFGCTDVPHSQIPLVGLFNMPGIMDSGVEPIGALCQLQINENIFIEHGSKKNMFRKDNGLGSSNAYEELMLISSMSTSNFYSRTLHRTNGLTLYPYWNQGVLTGSVDENYAKAFTHIGSCENKDFYKSLNAETFLMNMNFSNTAWPNELPNRLTSLPSAVCQYASAELYSFNATFVVPGVEFKRIFLIKDNITDFVMHKFSETEDTFNRRLTSPVMIVGIVTTRGDYFRVVLCDFDNGMANKGENHSTASWYNWCIFRHTNQPYLYRQYTPMENRERGKSVLFRASSLLLRKKIVTEEDFLSFPNNKDAQFHIVKDVLRMENLIHVLTSKNIHSVSLEVDCGSYVTCKDCASDPLCMWNISGKTCTNYTKETYSATNNVQDVLDRGFKCGTLRMDTSIKYYQYNKIMSFHCENAGFWRGKIEWNINENNPLKSFSSNFELSKNDYLVTFLNFDSKYTKISCYGIRDDHDTLFNDEEYHHVKNMSIRILLNVFEENYDSNIFRILFGVVFSLLLVGIIVLIILYYLRKRDTHYTKCRRDTSR